VIKRLQAIASIAPQCIAATILGLSISGWLVGTGHGVTKDVNISVLLPVKAGVAGVIVAALLSFWGYFWAEVAQAAKSSDVPAIVRAYRSSFAYLVPTVLLLFVSMAADFYLAVLSANDLTAEALSFGTFASSLVMLLAFLLLFTVRSLDDMKTLEIAGDRGPTPQPSGAGGSQLPQTVPPLEGSDLLSKK
jgi:hypothetical protein